MAMTGIEGNLAGDGSAGGGMAARIRVFDWDRTPVGPIETWPRSLVNNLGTLLELPFPGILMWGPDFTVCAYNDAYRPLLGAKKEALGQPFLEVWAEAREIIAPLLEGVFGGAATFVEGAEFTLLRGGAPETAYFDYAFSPVRDDAGTIGGVLNLAQEVTEKIRGREAMRRLNDTLEQQVADRTAVAEMRASQLQRLALELSGAEDRERKQIAGILHDDLQQHLAALRFHLQTYVRQKDNDRGAQNLFQLIDESMEKCRSLSHELSPPVLHRIGLLAALDRLASDMRENYGLTVRVSGRPDAEPASPALASMLYRSVRELLFNAVKHAGTDFAAVEAIPRQNRIMIRVQDEGKGFDPTATSAADGPMTGFGLFSIKERIECMGGRFSVDSRPGKGCRVTLEVPKDIS